MTDLELLRRLFYARFALGGKVEDYIVDDDPELWRLVHARLNPESAALQLDLDAAILSVARSPVWSECPSVQPAKGGAAATGSPEAQDNP